MSQNSHDCLLPVHHSRSDPLKQAPSPSVDVVPVQREELTPQVIVLWPCLVFHSWRLCHRRKRWTLHSVPHPPGYRVPYHPSKQIFDGYRAFVLHWNHSRKPFMSCAALVCCHASLCLFPDCSPHHIVYILFLHRPSTCSMFVWNGLLCAHFNPFVLPMNGNDQFTEQNLQEKNINML